MHLIELKFDACIISYILYRFWWIAQHLYFFFRDNSGGSRAGGGVLGASAPSTGQQSELKYSENFLHQFLETQYDQKIYFAESKKKKKRFYEGQAWCSIFLKYFTIFPHSERKQNCIHKIERKVSIIVSRVLYDQHS